MTIPEIYLASALIVLAMIVLLIFWVRRREYRVTPLISLAFALVVAGILFGHDRLVGYSLMAVGVVLALIEWLRRKKA